jgi:hypothetical protein
VKEGMNFRVVLHAIKNGFRLKNIGNCVRIVNRLFNDVNLVDVGGLGIVGYKNSTRKRSKYVQPHRRNVQGTQALGWAWGLDYQEI